MVQSIPLTRATQNIGLMQPKTMWKARKIQRYVDVRVRNKGINCIREKYPWGGGVTGRFKKEAAKIVHKGGEGLKQIRGGGLLRY